ncbi:hypothetical protein CROQUDRAFT_52089, partial [Cronartium quercuum f. sp. fusiforme G11]
LYYSTKFQKHLVLKVMDEAHVIYLWGLVSSGLTKGLHKAILNWVMSVSSGQNMVTLGRHSKQQKMFLSFHCLPPADLLQLNKFSTLIPHHTQVANDNLPSTIIYSSKQDATFTVSQQVHLAQSHPTGVNDGNSMCCWVYHAATSPKEKSTHTSDYDKGVF